MKYFTGNTDIKIEAPLAITLGKFDGLHRGHQKLITKVLSEQEGEGLTPAVFTFDMSPRVLAEGREQSLITTNQERKVMLERMGIEYLIEYPFTQQVSHMLPEVFVREVLVKKLHVKSIVVGTDFCFGYQRRGDAGLLEELSGLCGYKLHVIEKLRDNDDRIISSSYIREQLDMGEMEKANELLGYPYCIHGTVLHGNHLGSRLGFPTANLMAPDVKKLPPKGVYISRTRIGNRICEGVSNIGCKPTIEGKNPLGVETYLYDWNEDIYGKEIEVQLLHYQRPERKFDSLEQLKHQVEKDKIAGIEYFSQ